MSAVKLSVLTADSNVHRTYELTYSEHVTLHYSQLESARRCQRINYVDQHIHTTSDTLAVSAPRTGVCHFPRHVSIMMCQTFPPHYYQHMITFNNT